MILYERNKPVSLCIHSFVITQAHFGEWNWEKVKKESLVKCQTLLNVNSMGKWWSMLCVIKILHIFTLEPDSALEKKMLQN